MRFLPALALLPLPLAPAIPSTNWSGYEAYVPVRFIQASWTLPVTRAQDNFPTWIGLGGEGKCSTLIQAGTTYNPNLHHYTVWWEYVRPSDAGPVNVQGFILKPGGSVTVSISYRTGRSTFTIRDGRTGRSKTVPALTPNACQSPADFVVERLGRPVRFGTITFTHCEVNGLPLDAFRPTRLVMRGTNVGPLTNSRFSVQALER